MEAPVERRVRETFERCTTDAQRATVERLHSEGVTAWPEKRTGKGVVAAFKRYVTTGDSEKINEGLYGFSIYVLSEIAHYDIHGFRAEYRHPAKYLRFLVSEAERGYPLAHSQHVYTDGMTGREVMDEMLRITVEAGTRVMSDERVAKREAELGLARALAEANGMKLVPINEGGA